MRASTSPTGSSRSYPAQCATDVTNHLLPSRSSHRRRTNHWGVSTLGHTHPRKRPATTGTLGRARTVLPLPLWPCYHCDAVTTHPGTLLMAVGYFWGFRALPFLVDRHRLQGRYRSDHGRCCVGPTPSAAELPAPSCVATRPLCYR